MNALDTMFRELFQEALDPHKIIPILLVQRLKQLGIILEKAQETHINEQFKDDFPKQFSINFSDKQIEKLREVGKTPEDLVVDIDNMLSDDNISKIASDMIIGISETSADVFYKSWKEQLSNVIAEDQKERLEFELHLQKAWKHSIDLLHALVSICSQYGSEFNLSYRPMAV